MARARKTTKNPPPAPPSGTALPGAAPPFPQARPPRDLASTRRLVDYVEEIWKWRWVLLGASFLGALLMALYVAAKPNIFVSRAQLMVTAPRGRVDLTQVLGLRAGQANFTPTQEAIAILSSRDLAERVVDRVGPAEILKPAIPSLREEKNLQGLHGFFSRLLHKIQRALILRTWGNTPPSPALAVRVFRSSLKIYWATRSPSIRVEYRSNHPARSQKILQAYLEEGLRFYIECRSSKGDESFLQREMDKAEKEYVLANQAYRNFLEEHKVADIPSELARVQDEFARLDERIRQARLRIASLEETQKTLQENIRQFPPFLKADAQVTAAPDPGLQLLEGEILKVQIELQKERIVSASQTNPRITELEKELAFLEKKKKDLLAKGPILTKTTQNIPNPEYETRRTRLLEVTLELQSLKASLPAMEREKKNLLEKIGELTRLEPVWRDLKARLARAQEQKTVLQQRVKNFRISRQLDALGLSNLKVIETPSFEPKKEGPVRGKYILAGFFGVLIFLCPLIMILFRVSTKVNRGAQITALLGVEVPASIPRLRKGSIRKFIRARNLGWD